MGLEFLLGAVVRLFPEIASLFTKKADNDHELAMLNAQLEVDKLRGRIEQQKIEITGKNELDKSELEAIIEATKAQGTPIQRTGNAIVDVFAAAADIASKFVRPVLTYWYCVGAYGAYKTALYMQLMAHNIAWNDAVLQLWTVQDQDVMLSILGFWFTDRALRHLNGKPPK